jgi:magnesium transporter
MNIIKTKKLTWIDIKKQTESDVQHLSQTLSIQALILQELLPPSYRSKVEQYEDQLYLVLYFPVFHKDTRQTRPRELDIIVTKDTVITSHYLSILPLKELFNRCNLYEESKEKYMGRGSGMLLYYIVESLLQACLPKLDHIAENIEKIEDQIFKGKEKEMLSEISIVKRDILNMAKAIKPEEGILHSLHSLAPKFFGSRMKIYFQDLLGSYDHVRSVLDNHQEMIEALQATNESLLSNKISEIIKILTVISFITFPLGVIAGIFGMNVFHSINFVNHPATFWLILIFMTILSGTMVAIFKKKKWL